MAEGSSDLRVREFGRARTRVRLLAVLAAGLLLAAACTSSGDDAEATEDDVTPDREEGAVGEVAGERDSHDPEAAQPTGDGIVSAASGAWSDGDTWEGGEAPADGDAVTILSGHEVTADVSARIDGMAVGGDLSFDPETSVTIGSTANIIVGGTLTMKPADAGFEHIVEFLGVNEEDFLGGGLEPLEPDVGLWVTGPGQLDLEGAERRSWSSLTGGVEAGATVVEVDDATGWQVGDEVVLTPTEAPIEYDDALATYAGFHETTIAAIDGTTVTLADGTARAHPLVDGQYAGELMNLTRNVIIRGTSEGKSHVFVHTHEKPQFVRWVLLDRLGVPEVLGRYPLHFHHAYESARGSLVEGVAVRDGGHHAFVPHESHGVTMRDLVAYNIAGGDAYWWDEGDQTHDLVWEHVMSALTEESAFYLGRGDNVTIRDAVAVGIWNRQGNVGGFEWENGAVGNWQAENLVAHNNNNRGIRVWQNSDIPQVVDGIVAYHNTGPAIEHGAYTNSYAYRNGHFIGNWEGGIILQAVTRSGEDSETQMPEITFENMVIDSNGTANGAPFLIQGSSVPADQPVLLRNVVFEGESLVEQPAIHFQGSSLHQIRCVECTFPDQQQPVWFEDVAVPEDTWVELLDGSGSQRLRPIDADPGASYNDSFETWVADIARPVPDSWGTGVGLTVEYFEDPELTDLVYTTVLPYTFESHWTLEGTPYYQIDASDGAGVRWSGQVEIEPDQGGTYTFSTGANGGVELRVDGQQLISDPDNQALNDLAGLNEGSIELEGGQRYDIEVEIWDPVGFEYFVYWIEWTRPNGRSEILPTTQLHPAGPIPDNDPIIALN